MSATALIVCTNHPQTETLLRCNRCDKPYCVKCLVRTPVGLSCRVCLNIQQAGYYTATSTDYLIAAIVGMITAIVGGAISAALAGIWLIQIFYAPFAGGVIAEIIQRALQRRRGQFVAIIASVAVFIGSAIGAGMFPFFSILAMDRAGLPLAIALPLYALGSIFSIGFLIYIVFVLVTVYARLKS